MSANREDRRRYPGELAQPDRPTATSMLVLLVSGVLLLTAAAAVLLGGGYDDETPHGQLLGTLQRVAEAQEARYRSDGAFAYGLMDLDVEVSDSVDVTMVRGAADRWEAVARHPVGLTCVQSGWVEAGRPVREPPGCFTR